MASNPKEEELRDFAEVYERLRKRYATFDQVKGLFDQLVQDVKRLKAPLEKLTSRAEKALKEQEQGLRRLDERVRSTKDGAKGEKGDRGERGANGRDGIDGVDGIDGKNGSPDTATQIATKLNTTHESVNLSVIRGLEAKLKELDQARIVRGGVFGGGRPVHVPMVDVFTGDGSTKTFYLSKAPRDLRTATAMCTDFPHILAHDHGFTISGKALTFDANTDAPSDQARIVVPYYV